MISLSKDIIPVVRENELVLARNRVREFAIKVGMSLVNQTKLITAASELIRNMLKYANGGTVTIEIISKGPRTGVRITFADKGPGIANISDAMRDGFSTGRSLGLGLPGTKRLVSEFDIKSIVGEGTTVTVIHWKNGL